MTLQEAAGTWRAQGQRPGHLQGRCHGGAVGSDLPRSPQPSGEAPTWALVILGTHQPNLCAHEANCQALVVTWKKLKRQRKDEHPKAERRVTNQQPLEPTDQPAKKSPNPTQTRDIPDKLFQIYVIVSGREGGEILPTLNLEAM